MAILTAAIHAALTLKSSNAKTGPIPVSSTSAATCPDNCPLRERCYAASGHTAIHWRKITAGTRGDPWQIFCSKVAKLPAGQLWRHNVAGDLVGDRRRINPAALRKLVAANTGKRGFTYTHYSPTIGNNAALIREANESGFTINLSANSPAHADSLASLGIAPVVTILPIDAPRKLVTPAGRKVATCPATYRDVTCADCGLCQSRAANRPIVGFPAHGTWSKLADNLARD